MSTYIFQGVAPTTPLLHLWFKTYLLKYALNLALGMILVLYYNKTLCSFWGVITSPLWICPWVPFCGSYQLIARNTLCIYTEGPIIAKSIAVFLHCS